MKEILKNSILIINADDFGLSEGINKGIIEAYKNGILTSTSICANGAAFDSAVRLAKEHPNLDIGIHLILVGEKPLSEPNKVRSLIDDEGNFHQSAAEFTKRYYFGKINLDEVKAELSLQFSKIIESGLELSHIDSHQHVHALSGIYSITKEFAENYNISFIRTPGEKLTKYMLQSPKTFPRILQQYILKMISTFSTKNSKFNTVNNFAGFYFGGNLSKANFLKIISNLQSEQITEIMCHPAYFYQNDNYKFWNYNHEKELAALLDKEVLSEITAKKIRLTNFKSV